MQTAETSAAPSTDPRAPISLADPVLISALDSLGTNVFIADLDLRLAYVNRRGAATLRELSEEIQKMFAIGTDLLVGSSIHRFHSDPARVERILRDPANMPHRATLAFGDARLRAEFNHIRATDGTLLGYVANWESVGERDRASEAAIEELISAAHELTDISAQLGSGFHTTASQAISVASGAEEMSASINEIAGSSARASTVANESTQIADLASASVTKLGSSSEEIENFASLISTVASQTNLLALNATIEAARAGEAGKGFAVVASEVKALAQQTKQASQDIEARVRTIVADVSSADDAISRISTAIDEISHIQAEVASSVSQQHTVATDISANIAAVASQADISAQDADRIGALAESLMHQVESLRALLLAH